MLPIIWFKPKKVRFILYSGFCGDNCLVAKSDRMEGYHQSLVHYPWHILNDFIKPPVRHRELPVIFNIIILRELDKSSAELSSRAPSLLKMSLELCPLNSGKKVVKHWVAQEAAWEGLSGWLSQFIHQGYCQRWEGPAWWHHLRPEGGQPWSIKAFTASMVAVQEQEAPCASSSLVMPQWSFVALPTWPRSCGRWGRRGGQKIENPPELCQYENAELEFDPSQPLFVEPFEKCATLGRIAVVDSNLLKMLGKVTGTTLVDWTLEILLVVTIIKPHNFVLFWMDWVCTLVLVK